MVFVKRADFSASQPIIPFNYWLILECVSPVIIEPEVHLGGRCESIQLFIDKLHFGDKISIISELYSRNPKKDAFISFMWKINALRNDVAHGRFGNLKYEGLNLSDARGQLKIIADLMNALLKK